MRFLALFAGALGLCPAAIAQDSYWVASRFSNDLHEISPCGEVLNTVSLGTSLRSAHVAPDGKIWVVRFIQPQFDILNPDGTLFASPTATLGNPFDIAFDNQGTAWVSGGTGVEQFAANGLSIQTIPLPTGAPLGITIDAQNNKWIAHRVGPPGTVSRIDGTSGAVTSHPLPTGSLILPTRVMADLRGTLPMVTSHVWVVGDNRGAGELVELDPTGAVVNSYNLDPGGAFGSLTLDLNGLIYAGDFRTGNIFQVDPNNPMNPVRNVFQNLPNVIGLNTDSFGRIWATTRVSFSGPQPSEVRRLDPATGALEFPAVVGLGTQSALSTQFHYLLVAAPFGDVDQDGVPNAFELQAGTSPLDPQSTGFASVNANGVTARGSTASVDLRVQTGATTFLAFGFGAVPPGSGITAAGVGGEFLLNPAGVLGVLFLPGSASVPVTIPVSTAIGTNVKFQGVTLGSLVQFTNVTCIEAW